MTFTRFVIQTHGHGYDRNKYKWHNQHEQNLIIACASSSSSYTEQDMLFVTEESSDITQKLYLNGNTLKEISCGEKILSPKSDYTVTNNSITFSDNFLKQFKQGDHDEKAVLTLSFSGGADWLIKVYYSTLPEYGTLAAKTQNMRIPVKFNGNIVTTLEAVDPVSGAAVGPHNWTTFKEFNYAFVVNYKSDSIVLTKAFQDEFSGNSVLFRIHYANGTVDEYLMNITDGIIAGAPVSRSASYDITDKNIGSGTDGNEKEDKEEEFTGNKVLASLDVLYLNANAFSTEATFTLNNGEEPSICLRLNGTDDQYYYLGSQEYDGWFQSYPHLGGVLVTKSGTYKGEKVAYKNILTLAVETWDSAKPESMKIYLYSGDKLVGTAEYSANSSQLTIK